MERQMGMVERCAKAIYEKRNGAGCKPWSIQTKAHKAPYLDDARAAIEAMRSHTPAMDSAGYGAYPDSVIRTGVDHLDIYRAMIDAALKEHEEGKVG